MLIPTSPTDSRVPQSLAYHLADVYVEELDRAIAAVAQTTSNSPAPVVLITTPFLTLAAHTPSKTIYQRVQEVVLEPLFASLPFSSTGHPSGDGEHEEPTSRKRSRVPSREDAPYAHIGLGQNLDGRQRLLRHLFTVASAQDTRDANRRRLYTFWRELGDDEE